MCCVFMAMKVNVPAQDFTVMLAAGGAACEGCTNVMRCLDGATTAYIQTERDSDVAGM